MLKRQKIYLVQIVETYPDFEGQVVGQYAFDTLELAEEYMMNYNAESEGKTTFRAKKPIPFSLFLSK